MRNEYAGQLRYVWPFIWGATKPESAIPEIRVVVSMMRTLTVVDEEGILRSGGAWAMMR